MKVICFIDSLGGGGAQRQLTSLAVLLREQNVDSTVVVYHDRPFYLGYLKKNGVPYYVLQNATKPLSRIIRFYRYFKNEKPDWVIAYQDTPSIVACICKMLGCKFRLIVSERNTTQRIITQTKIKFNLYRVADYVVPNSNSQKEFILSHFSFLKNKVRVITNFIDTGFFKPIKKNISKPLEILSVARIYPQKNAPRFVEAVKLAVEKGASFHVSWYGAKGSDYPEAQEKIERYHLEKFIEFKVPNNNIIEAYHNSDVFVLPSIFEGFPNVLCEAMSCGLPVLFSNVCDNPLIARDGYNGYLLEPLDVNQMAEALMRMASNAPKEINIMGERSREIIENNFSKQLFVDKYLELIQ